MKRNEFLKDITGDNNHRLLLWEALKVTTGDIVEYGSGYGSTQYLRKFAKDSQRNFLSFDNGKEWADIHDSTYIPNNDWDSINPRGSIILIDHAPGERRWVDILRLKDNFDIFVIHDSEPIGAGDYKLEKIWGYFKYRVDVKCDGSWASAVSNTIDLEAFKGTKFNKFEIS